MVRYGVQGAAYYDAEAFQKSGKLLLVADRARLPISSVQKRKDSINENAAIAMSRWRLQTQR
jgi:hypothetical protein